MYPVKLIPIKEVRTITRPSIVRSASLASQSPAGILYDKSVRALLDLRISVTDRCNLRCTYCMPREIFDKNHVYLPRKELLSLEEIIRVSTVFVSMGIRKIRIAGGEPLLRRGIENLIEKLALLQTPAGEFVEIAMTTNGVLLSAKAQALKDAGLSRITVSLDALDDEIFQHMSDSKVQVKTILDGIATAQRVGFSSIKVNMVVKRGVNDGEILSMARHFRNTGVILRFIEYMDVGSSNGWVMDEVMPAQQIIDLISNHYPLLAQTAQCSGEVAKRWVYDDGAGEIGVIASVTQVFCHACTRIRLSTDGKLYTCLFAEHSNTDLRVLLRQGYADQEIGESIATCWQDRIDRYSELRNEATALPRNKVEMSYIGG